jgi:hypothetical protein
MVIQPLEEKKHKFLQVWYNTKETWTSLFMKKWSSYDFKCAIALGTVKVGVPKKVVFTKISTHVSVSNKSIS